jgi:polar amino acid transport system substrate-binding protein
MRSRLFRKLTLWGLVAAVLASGCQTHRSPRETEPTRGLARVIATGELRVGMSGDQPPMNLRTESGHWLGFDVALARLLATHLQVEATIVVRPFFRLLDALEAGEVDVVISGMTINARRNLRAAFVGPYFVSGKSILAKRETIDRFQTILDLNHPEVRLAALAGSTSEEFVANNAPRAQLTLAERLSEAVELLLSDQVDAVVADYETCALAQLQHPDADLKHVQETLTVEPMGIAVPPDDVLLANLLENYLEALQLSGSLDRIREFWFEDETWLRQVEEREAAWPAFHAAERGRAR